MTLFSAPSKFIDPPLISVIRTQSLN